jgi:hypothetical protein
MRTGFGTRAEPNALDGFTAITGAPSDTRAVETRNEFYMRALDLEYGSGDQARTTFLGGRVDGFTDGKVIEAKNRMVGAAGVLHP